MNAAENRWDCRPLPEDMILFFAAGLTLRKRYPEYDHQTMLLYNQSDSTVEKENFLRWLNESALPALEHRLEQSPENSTAIDQWAYDEGRYHMRVSLCCKCGNCIINGWTVRE